MPYEQDPIRHKMILKEYHFGKRQFGLETPTDFNKELDDVYNRMNQLVNQRLMFYNYKEMGVLFIDDKPENKPAINRIKLFGKFFTYIVRPNYRILFMDLP